MLDFEKNVVQLFEAYKIDYHFDDTEHYLTSSRLNIFFIAVCSLQDFIVNDRLPTKSVNLVRLWEDEYIHHNQVIDSRILSLIGISKRIYARETKIKSISQPDLNDFLTANHLNKPIVARHRYGLFKGQELVAVAAFSRSCPIQVNEITYKSHELIRYCSLLNTTVVGGLSKLISHFEKQHNPEHIMTYVDREWSDGKSYQQLGFKVIAETLPQKFWLSPENYERIPVNATTGLSLKSEPPSEVWTTISNLGNLKLVKFLK